MKSSALLLRILAGLVLVIVLLAGLFAVIRPILHRWGSTDAELALTLPGDELLTAPLVSWRHAITIDAPPQEVWQWIIQMGDDRAAFYSYTFIENRVSALMGASDYQAVYRNASQVVPEWQNPALDTPIIQGALKITEYERGHYLLASSIDPQAMNWVWSWTVKPLDNGSRTRLYVNFGIEMPAGTPDNPVMGFMMDVGGFVMEQNMMQGIKLRAEGGSEPDWIEVVEIGLWLAALAAGVVSAVLYVARKAWYKGLSVALAAVLVLFVLTFVQPAIWLRFLMGAALAAGAVWAWRK